jgi:hypothetical protein
VEDAKPAPRHVEHSHCGCGCFLAVWLSLVGYSYYRTRLQCMETMNCYLWIMIGATIEAEAHIEYHLKEFVEKRTVIIDQNRLEGER